MFAVTGASGHPGRLAIAHLLERIPVAQIVAAMRDPTKGADLLQLGVQVRQAGRTYELAADNAFTLAELAEEVSRQSRKTVAYHDLSPAAYEGVLADAGLPAPLASLLADADLAASQGALFDDSSTLSKLIGQPTTRIETLIAATLSNTAGMASR